MSADPNDSFRLYAIGAGVVGATLTAVGVAMHFLSKKSDEKETPSYPFYKDATPTREFKPPFIGGFDYVDPDLVRIRLVRGGPHRVRSDWFEVREQPGSSLCVTASSAPEHAGRKMTFSDAEEYADVLRSMGFRDEAPVVPVPVPAW